MLCTCNIFQSWSCFVRRFDIFLLYSAENAANFFVQWKSSSWNSNFTMYCSYKIFLTRNSNRFKTILWGEVSSIVNTKIAGTVPTELSASCLPSSPADVVWSFHQVWFDNKRSLLWGSISISWTSVQAGGSWSCDF